MKNNDGKEEEEQRRKTMRRNNCAFVNQRNKRHTHCSSIYEMFIMFIMFYNVIMFIIAQTFMKCL